MGYDDAVPAVNRTTLFVCFILSLSCISGQAATRNGSKCRCRRSATWLSQYQQFAQRESLNDPITKKWLQNSELTLSSFPATMVTALYDIKRAEDGDGRSIDDYLQWMQKTIQLKAPLVAFVGDPEHAKFVAMHRSGQPTLIITRRLEKLRFHKLRNLIAANQQKEEWRNCHQDPDRMENKVPLYICIIFNKFEFMSEVATANPFGSEYFFWLDAGISRFQEWTGNLDLITNHTWPNVTRVRQVDPHGDKLIIPLGNKDDHDYTLPKNLYEYYCKSGDGFLATMFGGTARAMHRVLADAEDFLYNEVLPMGAVANEQMFFFVWNARNNSRVHPIPEADYWYSYLS